MIDRKERIIASGIFPTMLRGLFPDAKETGKDQVLVRCPFHDDRNPSLSVNLSAGLFQCFACGAKGGGIDLYMKLKNVDFLTALDQLEAAAGITSSKRGNVKKFPQLVATFCYHDEAGSVRYWKKRFEPGFEAGRSKSFAFYHQSGKKEVKGRGGDPLLYNLPMLASAPLGAPVFILEGEAKVDVLTGWGLHATCLDSGAQSGNGSSWRDDFKKYFKGREVIFVTDNDEPGEKYARTLAGKIKGVAEVVKVLRLPGLPPKGDIIDWVRLNKGESLE